jgi:chlorite dismutase
MSESSDKPASGAPGRPMPGTSGHGSHELDVNEYGAPKDGERQVMDRRLFMQLLVYDTPPELHSGEVIDQLATALGAADVGAVLYQDVANPNGFGLLTWSDDPTVFVERVRPVMNDGAMRKLRLKPEFTMMGRTYATGYEPDLEYWILRRPAETCLNPSWPWAVWYPLRRSGAFAQLSPKEQGGILREHAVIGRAYGERDLAHDVRLACHGIDQNDNEFVIGLVGKELYPLSHVVQSMRKTRQTSEYIVQMGPFFVGHAVARTR